MKKIILISLLSMAFPVSPAHALWGVGDVSYDPTAYAELVKIYTTTVDLYKNAQNQLKTLDDMRSTIIQAKEGVDALRNFDIQKAIDDLKTGNLSGNKNKIAALRSQMYDLESKLGGDKSYIQYQLQRISNLEKLQVLQAESAKNAEKASKKGSGSNADSKITAQSTSIMATLAAAEHQRKQEEDMQAAKDLQTRKELSGGSYKIYDAMGGH